MSALPTGTVTFLFTDIEGSTRLLHELGDTYADALAEHRRVLRGAFERHGGVEVDTQGDAFFVAFDRASDALAAAREATEVLEGPIRVRMGVHTGEPLVTEEGYFGIDVHRAARIAAAGHGGQILVSQSTRELVGGDALRDLGEHRLKDLSAPERIYQLGDGEFPPLKSLNNSNLPLPAEALLGRKKELADVLDTFRSGVRLVTVTGPGGIGKTRFALEVAAELLDEFPDGVWWVGLAPLRDPQLVLPTIAAAVGATSDVESELRGKHLLLLLDNFEQIVDAAAAVAELQRVCPNMFMLVTSREPLHVAGEREYPLEPLAESSAVELFRRRAEASTPAFTASYDQLIELCDRIDRLPLAIELAAARTKSLGLPDLLERLDDRLPLLASRRRDVDERQRTLRATIEWSYDLLFLDEQALFARLSVFAGSFDAAAAEDVCHADLDTLESLLDKSLMRRNDNGRFFLLETIREFASDVLDEQEHRETAKRHAEHYLLSAEETRLRSREGDLRGGLSRLDSERENMRAALAYFEEARAADELARLIDAVAYYWLVRGQLREGDRWIQVALAELRPDRPALVVELLVWESDFARTLGELERALASAQDALTLAREIDDARLVARSLHELGESYVALDDTPAATVAYEEAVDVLQQAGESPAGTLGNLADLDLAEGRFEEAAERLVEVRQLLAETADSGTQLVAEYNYVVALLHLDRRGEAQALLKDVLAGLRDLGYLEGVAWALLAAATALRASGKDDTAARLLGAAEQILDETGTHVGPTERHLHKPLMAFVGERGLDDARAQGRELSHEEAIDLAMQSLD